MDFHPELCLSFFYFWSILCADESEGEGEVKVETKEEQELETLQTWMEVGGLPVSDQEGAQNCCRRYIPLFCLVPTWVSSWVFLLHFTSHISVFVSPFIGARHVKEGEFPEGRGPSVGGRGSMPRNGRVGED